MKYELRGQFGGVDVVITNMGLYVEPWSAYTGSWTGGRWHVSKKKQLTIYKQILAEAKDSAGDIGLIANLAQNYGDCLRKPYQVK